MFVSVHIPKTAGTMLGYIFDHGSARRLLWDYTSPVNLQPLFREHVEFIEGYFWGVHGHFHLKKYLGFFRSPIFITTLRHPVDRAVSQYKHEVYEVVRNGGAGNWRAPHILSGQMSLVDFIRSDENVRKAQTVHVEGLDIQDFDFVFSNDNLISGLCAFGNAFGFQRADPEIDALPRINETSARPFENARQRQTFERLIAISEADRTAAYNLMPEEVDLFGRGVEKANALIRKYG